jgi:hypothetical protein
MKTEPVRYAICDILSSNGQVLWKHGEPIPPIIFDAVDNKWIPNPYLELGTMEPQKTSLH